MVSLFSFHPGTEGEKAAPREISRDVRELTISYDMEIIPRKRNSGVSETYNGGVKTIFIQRHRARLRMISLMRIQDIFLEGNPSGGAVMVKESGKSKYKKMFTEAEWRQYNNKYSDVRCELKEDTATILHYPCKKAVVKLKDGRSFIVFYTTAVQNDMLSLLEPAFSKIPGVVLKYEYAARRGMIRYTATSIRFKPISPAVFSIPEKGYPVRN